MHTRSIRFVLLVVLLASGALAAWFLYDIDRRTTDLHASRQTLDQRIDAIADLITAIGTVQQRYVAPGQSGESWFDRMPPLMKQWYDAVAALAPELRSPEARRTLRAVTESAESVIAADTRARENLRLGQPLMAADVIFSDGRSTLDMMLARLREIRVAEINSVLASVAALERQRWVVLASVGALWFLGLVTLVPAVPGRQDARGRAGLPADRVETESASSHPEPTSGKPAVASTIDLAATAAVCTALSRVSDAAELQALLQQAARLLDASGIILWMGAGEELFAVTAYGYPPHIVKALGPIARAADNATAAAWRTGEVTTVAAGRNGSGAVVAPMFGPAGCLGALAFEVHDGREKDADSRAVAALIAAQLATAVTAWPPASTVEETKTATA
jgi:hypothetical protein